MYNIVAQPEAGGSEKGRMPRALPVPLKEICFKHQTPILSDASNCIHYSLPSRVFIFNVSQHLTLLNLIK